MMSWLECDVIYSSYKLYFPAYPEKYPAGHYLPALKIALFAPVMI